MQNLVFVCFCKSFKTNQVVIKLTVTIEQAHNGIYLLWRENSRKSFTDGLKRVQA